MEWIQVVHHDISKVYVLEKKNGSVVLEHPQKTGGSQMALARSVIKYISRSIIIPSSPKYFSPRLPFDLSECESLLFLLLSAWKVARDRSFFPLALSLFFFLFFSSAPRLPGSWIHLRVNEFRDAWTGTLLILTNVHVESEAGGAREDTERATGETRVLGIRRISARPYFADPWKGEKARSTQRLHHLASISFRFSLHVKAWLQYFIA